jgi:hypothetical protein
VLDDFAVVQAEEVGERPSAFVGVVRLEVEVGVGRDKVAFGDDALDVGWTFGYSLRSHFTKPMNASGPSWASGLCWM